MCYGSAESPTDAQRENISTVLLAYSTLHSNNLNCSHILLAVKHVTVLWYAVVLDNVHGVQPYTA